MVEVFKTNVRYATHATELVQQLAEHFPSFKINFDLTDCDKILRVEGDSILSCRIIELLQERDYECALLD